MQGAALHSSAAARVDTERRALAPQRPLHIATTAHKGSACRAPDAVDHSRGSGRRRAGATAAASPAQLLSWPLLGLTCKATLKLGCICAAVTWLIRKERLPAETPSVLSKLAFNVTIPCMLVTKTAETLARTKGDWRYMMVPLAAAVQARSTQLPFAFTLPWPSRLHGCCVNALTVHHHVPPHFALSCDVHRPRYAALKSKLLADIALVVMCACNIWLA